MPGRVTPWTSRPLIGEPKKKKITGPNSAGNLHEEQTLTSYWSAEGQQPENGQQG